MWLTFRAYLATLFKVVSPEVVFISIGAAMVLLAVVLHEVLMAKIGFSFLGVALVISAYDLLLKDFVEKWKNEAAKARAELLENAKYGGKKKRNFWETMRD